MARTGTPTQITVHDSQGNAVGVFLWSDGSVTTDSAGAKLANSKWQPGGENYSQVTSAAGGSTGGTGGAGGTPATGPGSSGIPGIGNYPAATGITVTQPAGDPYGAAARFGGIPGGSLDPLNYRIYTGNMSTAALPPGSTNPGTPAPVPVPQPQPVPAPVPSPSPAPPPGSGGSGAPSPGGGTGGQAGGAGGLPPAGQTPGAGSGSGTGQGGNAGGAQGADRGGFGGRGMSFGNEGGGGANTRVTAQPTGPNSVDIAAEQGLTPGSLGYIDIGSIGTGLLGAASTLAPFPYSLIPTLAGGAMRAINTGTTDSIRAKQGLPGLDFGQWAGSVLGLNNYGSTAGDATIANPDQYGDWQKALDAKQLGNYSMTGGGPAAGGLPGSGGESYNPTNPDLFKTNTLGLPTGETVMGDPYSSGPGGLLGWAFGGGKQPAASVQTTNDQMSGDEAAKRLVETSGLSLAEARAALAKMKLGQPGSSALTGGNSFAGPGAVASPGSSGASTATGPAAVRGIGAGNLVPAAPVATATAPKAKSGMAAPDGVHQIPSAFIGTAQAIQYGYDANGRYVGGGGGTAGDNGLSNPYGLNRGYDVGNNSNDRSSANTNAAGQASNATGAYGQRGIGAGTYMGGGFIRGRPDAVPDNRTGRFNEGEFVVSNDPAKILGPTVLNWLNNAPHAARARGLLEGLATKADPKGPGASGEPRSAISAAAAGDLRNLTNQEPLMMGRTVGREPRGVDAATPASIAELMTLLAADGSPNLANIGQGSPNLANSSQNPPVLSGQMPTSPRGAPLAMPLRKPMVLAGRVIPGKGIGAGKLAKAVGRKPAGPSESDRLNQQMLAMILARRASQQASAGQGMRFGA